MSTNWNQNRKQFLAYLGQQMEAGLLLGVRCSVFGTTELGPASRSLASDDSLSYSLNSLFLLLENGSCAAGLVANSQV
ncbi:olfactory receptor [Cricetulus griseus]|uniref:Olfactory receptor n=1 Tax=Cricetulus griseus TaxID=10029 RepID=A0A061IFL8_CRIGR|nr:olfactory receptor [Cricetulus griseus]